MTPPHPSSTPFPYTTLFRSEQRFEPSNRARDKDSFELRGHALFRPPLTVPLPQRFALCRSEEHTSELQSHSELVCRLLLEKKKNEHAAWRNKSATTSLSNGT